MPNKRGAISDFEKKFLKENYKHLSPAEIAEKLERTEETVRGWLITILKVSPDDDLTQEEVERLALEKDLVKSPEWDNLKQEFSEEELRFFKNKYAKYMAQFRSGSTEVLATEESQIFTLIRYEILKHRNLAETNDSLSDSKRLEKMLKDTYDTFPDVASMDKGTKDLVLNLENQLASMRVARQAKSTEYNNYSAKHSSIMKELKGTRDQRLTRIEESAGSILDIFKSLQHQEIQAQKGRHMEIMAKATTVAREKFSEFHTYADGIVDQPLLTPENVIGDSRDEIFDRGE